MAYSVTRLLTIHEENKNIYNVILVGLNRKKCPKNNATGLRTRRLELKRGNQNT